MPIHTKRKRNEVLVDPNVLQPVSLPVTESLDALLSSTEAADWS
jgi:hypothetical protein